LFNVLFVTYEASFKNTGKKNSSDGLVEIGTLSLCVIEEWVSVRVVMMGIWRASLFNSIDRSIEETTDLTDLFEKVD